MNLICKLFGHKMMQRMCWLGDGQGYSVDVLVCKRRHCEHMEDLPE